MTSTFYPPYHIGGDAVHVKYLAEELASMGHEVHVFHSMDAYMVKKRSTLKCARTESDEVYIHAFRTPLNASPYSAYVLGTSPSILKKFRVLVKSVEPNIVHHHNVSLLGYGMLNKHGSYLNLYTPHDHWLICQQNNLYESCKNPLCTLCAIRHRKPPQMWRYFAGFRKAVNSIDLMIAPSSYLRRVLLEQTSARLKSVVIPNFAPYPPIHVYKPDYSDYFLFVGVLEEHKGIMNLLKLFKKLENRIEAKLVIVGRGSLQTCIQNFITRNSLRKSVFFLGFVDNDTLYSLYRGARALVIPSFSLENSPLVALEALSVGTPAIASNSGGLSEIVSKIDRRLIFSNQTELENLLIGNSEIQFSRERLKEIYERDFSPRAYVTQYLEVIQDIHPEELRS